ncbi:MAG: hypothetical protein LBS11_10025 [Oscillospiraceae bacterium]|nr:hypothetical protein [Oscillospiraceae bacterium]
MVTVGEDGRRRVRYAGPVFDVRWRDGRAAGLARLWICSAAAAASFAALGFVTGADASSRPYFAIPYILSLWPTAMLAADTVKIASRKPRVTRTALESGLGRLRRDALFGLVLASALAVGQAVKLAVMAAGGQPVWDASPPALIAASYALAFLGAVRAASLAAAEEAPPPGTENVFADTSA